MSTAETRILVQAAAAACEDKKGVDTRILELDPVDSGLADFFGCLQPRAEDRKPIMRAGDGDISKGEQNQ